MIKRICGGGDFSYELGTQHSDVSVGDHRVVGWLRDHLRSSIMTRISERQSLTREEKFVALVHLYAELRLPFAAAIILPPNTNVPKYSHENLLVFQRAGISSH